MALAGTTWTPSAVSPRLRETLVSVATVVVAALALASLVPAAVSALSDETSAAAGGPSPPDISLVGTVSTAGLPGLPAVSMLSVRNDGSDAVRWSVTTDVVGVGAPAVSVAVWSPDAASCATAAAAGSTLDWSRALLPAGATAPLCIRVSAAATVDGAAQPRVTVHARTA